MSYNKDDIDKSVAEKMLGDVFGDEPKPSKPVTSWSTGGYYGGASRYPSGGHSSYGRGLGHQPSMFDGLDDDNFDDADNKFGVSKGKHTTLTSAWGNSTVKKAIKGNVGTATQFCVEVIQEMAKEVEHKYGKNAKDRFLSQMLAKVEDAAWNGMA